MPELKLENSLVDGRYEVFERLGRGSYSEIFVARDRQANGMEIVIKALNTSLQGTPDVDLERTLIENFQNEAIALDTVRHSNVILRLGHGTAADLRGVPFHYLVLEYLPGGDLLKICRERPKNSLRLDEALFFFKQACEALAYAHSKGIIHRDLKPNNLLLSADHRTIKIADFGVAKIASSEKTEVTRVGADIYAPPEHNPNEESEYSERLTVSADIYSLAKSFYTVVCGRAPVQFRCDPITALPDELMQQPWGPQLLRVLCHSTYDEPAKRYSSVVEFWNDLVQVTEENGDEPAGEETIVKPRLNVGQGVVPKTPLRPDFEPALAAMGSHAAFTSAKPVDPGIQSEGERDRRQMTEPDRRGGRSSKFFINLQESKPAPVVMEPPPAGTQAGATGTTRVTDTIGAARTTGDAGIAGKGEQRLDPGTGPKYPHQLSVRKLTTRFSEKLRLRLFLALLALAILGANVSVYNYVRSKGVPFGVGLPMEIEIVSPGLNVRSGPGNSSRVIGVIAKGSRHRVVLTQSDQGWMQIEVGQWFENEPHEDQKQGWVYGSPDKVHVVSRRIW